MIFRFIFFLLLLVSISCGNLQKVEIIKHPGSPMLITDACGAKVKVAIYDKMENKLIDYGMIEVPNGWTMVLFNWEDYLIENAKGE